MKIKPPKRILEWKAVGATSGLLYKVMLFVAPAIVLASLARLIYGHILLVSVLASLVQSMSPLIGLVVINAKLPKRVRAVVQEELPNHIEYAESYQLANELLNRDGVSVVFWTGFRDHPTKAERARIAHVLCNKDNAHHNDSEALHNAFRLFQQSAWTMWGQM